MKLGVFGNIYGDSLRLDRLLGEFDRMSVDLPVSTGNLIRDYDNGEDLEAYLRDSRILLDQFEAYPKGEIEDTPLYYLGPAENAIKERGFDGKNYTNPISQRILADG